jgi:hypothetical protein
MAIDAVWFNWYYFWATDGSTWSVDVEMAPKTVYASTALTGYAAEGQVFAFAGIPSYRTRNPSTAKDTTHNPPSSGGVPAGGMFDHHVDSVTFEFGILNGGAGAGALLQILIWD